MVKEECMAAISAALEYLSRKCGRKQVGAVPFPGGDFIIMVDIPNPAPEGLRDEDANLTLEERIRAIEESRWAQNLAKGMCEKLVGLEPGTPEYERCVRNVAHRVALGLVE